MSKQIIIDGVTYVPEAQPPSGSRIVLVGDRGWIFAGDASLTDVGEVRLDRAVGVRRWEGVGFNGMIANPTKKVVLEPMTQPVIFPAGSILFRVPVADNWGL
jgi:hypothetical protein